MQRGQRTDFSIRSYEIGDEGEVVELWNQCLPYDRITARIFEEKILLDPNFDLNGCKIAEKEGAIIGFVYALVRKTPLPWGFDSFLAEEEKGGVGYIVALFVHQEYRRKGVGSALLKEALNFLQSQKRKKVVLFSYDPNYLVAGLDTQSYPGALEFFEKYGFTIQGESVGMGRDLYKLRVPEQVKEREKRLRNEGIVARYFDPEYILPTISFFLEDFPHWLHNFVEKWERGHDLDEMVIVLKDDREVIGYCQHRFDHHLERVGPFGIDKKYRGRGIGSMMLYKLLNRMAEKGYKFAWFTSTDRAETYYARAGFKVIRKQVHMAKNLGGNSHEER